MISFNYETDFKLQNEFVVSKWIEQVIKTEGYWLGDINYIFCDDDYLLKLNIEFLKHHTLTDVISFDYTVDKQLNGDIFISITRVKENAIRYNVEFLQELNRVIIHGILHYCGYKDKTEIEQKQMRDKENEYLPLHS